LNYQSQESRENQMREKGILEREAQQIEGRRKRNGKFSTG
jgi:hypothetical protein